MSGTFGKPTKRQIAAGTYKLVDGKWHKLCTGPAHEEPEYLPATDKYYHFHKSGSDKGKPVSRCRLCINWSKLKSPGSHQGWIPAKVALPFYREAANRVGVMELSRRTGMQHVHLGRVLRGETKYVYKASLRRVMLELTSMQRKKEYSINQQAKWRADVRNNDGFAICRKCGTPVQNCTADCDGCYERHRRWWREGKISNKQWKAIRIERDRIGKNLIMGQPIS